MLQIFSRFEAFLLSGICKLMHVAYLPFTGDFNGLGNRIKAMANLWTLGYRRIVIAWRIEGWVNMPYDDLFYLRDSRILSFSGRGYKILRLLFRRFLPVGIFNEHTPFWAFLVPERFQRTQYRHKWSFSEQETYSIDFRFNNLEEDVRDLYRPFFQRLMPSEKVLQRIKSLAMPEDVVTVQVRNTDLKNDKKDVCSVETIFTVMDRYPGTQKFFISTMKKSISKMFHERYGDRILELPDKDPSSLIDAVADMWLLGHGREMIASPRSTFSEVAWWWSGASIPVNHLSSEYNQCNM